MGWTYTNKGSKTTKEFFESEFNYDKPAEGRSGKVIAFSATWRVAYMAYRVTTPEKTEVIGIVCLIHHVPRAADGYTFGYKDMTESMGPCESRCPGTILDLLTPTTEEYAIEWRKRCRERLEKRAAAPRASFGDWIKFSSPLTFRSGQTYDTLQWVKGSLFRRGYDLFRISNWREKEYKNLGDKAPSI